MNLRHKILAAIADQSTGLYYLETVKREHVSAKTPYLLFEAPEEVVIVREELLEED